MSAKAVRRAPRTHRVGQHRTGSGYFITLEGTEGAGKSTQARRLAAWLRRKGFRVVSARDPGSTQLGRALRRMLLHGDADLSPSAEALLFIGSRVALVEERIEPALREGAVVVCDRYHDATVAYQGFAGGAGTAWIARSGREAIHGMLPDLTLLLDLPPALGMRRLRRKRWAAWHWDWRWVGSWRGGSFRAKLLWKRW